MRFYEEIAKEIGMPEAVVYGYIDGWITTNVKKKAAKNIHHGYVWMFQSVSDMSKEMPYMSASTIKRAISLLYEAGWLATGRFNKKAYDKTYWYTTAHQGDAKNYTKFQPKSHFGKFGFDQGNGPNWYNPNAKLKPSKRSMRVIAIGQIDQMEEVKLTKSNGSDRPYQYHHSNTPLTTPPTNPSTNPTTHPSTNPHIAGCHAHCEKHLGDHQYYVAYNDKCVDFSTELYTAIVGIITPFGVEEARYCDLAGNDVFNIQYVKGGCDDYILP